MSFFRRLFGQQSDESSDPSPTPSEPFRMTLQDVFVIANRGIVVTGRVESGVLTKEDRIVLDNGTTRIETKAASLEMFAKVTTRVKEGDNVGILLPPNVPREVVEKGMIITREGDA